MTDQELERRLRAWYRSEIGDEMAPPVLRASLGAIPASVPAPRRWTAPGRPTNLLAAAALLAVALVGGALLAGTGIDRSPSVVPTPEASIAPVVPTPTLEATAQPSPTPSRGLAGSPLGGGWIIAYDPTTEAGAVDVYAIDAEDGARTLLGTLSRPSPPKDWEFQWANDRTRVLASRGFSSQTNEALDAPTEAGRRLTFICCIPPNDGWGPPVLSPSGDRIAVGGGIFGGNPTAGMLIRLSLPAGAEVGGLPSWSPDESALVIAGCSPCSNLRSFDEPPIRAEHGHLFVQYPDGSPTRQLLDETESNFGSPVWSPDGSTILISRSECTTRRRPPFCEGPVTVGAVSLASGALTTIATGGPEVDGWGPPAWSPDGARIAFAAPQGLVVMDRDGRNRVSLDVGPTEFIALNRPGPKWSPDSRWLMFMRGGELWIVPADGGAARSLGIYRGADW